MNFNTIFGENVTKFTAGFSIVTGSGTPGKSTNVYVGSGEPPETAEVWIDPSAVLTENEIPSIRVDQTAAGAIVTAIGWDDVTVAELKNGVNGIDGNDGYTPVKGIDYFDGKNGKDGKDGKDGADGYTPIKGTDYFTEADKAEMVSSVIAQLPVYDGSVTSV